jgi:DNA-directed RNA polymerase subunit M
MMRVEFCPKCDMRMRLRFHSRGALCCPTCSYRKEFLDYFVPEGVNSNKGIDDVVVLDKGTVALLTQPTITVYCEECGGRKAETWSVAVGSGTQGGIMYFRCLRCGHTWREME